MYEKKSRIVCISLLLLMTVVISLFTYNLGTGEINDIFSFSAFKHNDKIEINSMLSEENSLIILTPSASEFETEEPTVSFEGFCLPDKPLTVCSQSVHISDDGSFSCIVSLQEGKNNIEITNGDISLLYKINYEFNIIKDYSPEGNMSLNSGMLLEITVRALSGAEIYANIGNTEVELRNENNSDEAFEIYKGEYLIPEIMPNEDNVKSVAIIAELNGHKEVKECGKLTVLENKTNKYTVQSGEGEIVYPEFSGNSVILLSPRDDHNNGNAAMCIVTKDYAEVVPASTADDRNDPRYSPQLAGTVDYITGECKFDDQEYYILLSGTKIDKKNVEAFSGYIMPMNTVSQVNAEGSKLSLTMNWKVPFVSELKEQSYFVGHASRAFNVKSFTASYIDFCFKYTNAARENVSFENSEVVSHTQWLNIGKDGTSTLRVFLKSSGNYYGYKAYYSDNNRLIIEFKHKPVKGNSFVVIDPGHGGKDCGAIAVNGVYESLINMNISNIIKQRLEQYGVNVKLTHYDDNFYSLDERQDFGRKSGADLFVALHNNSTETDALSGTEVYYYRANSQPLAASIHSRLVSAWQGIYFNNSVMYEKIIPYDGGVRFYPFQVTRIEECPAVLVECGYLSNPVECDMLCNSENQRIMAYAVADGIMDYLNSVY